MALLLGGQEDDGSGHLDAGLGLGSVCQQVGWRMGLGALGAFTRICPSLSLKLAFLLPDSLPYSLSYKLLPDCFSLDVV